MRSRLWDFVLLVADGGMTKTGLNEFIRLGDPFDVRMKILKCDPSASVIELLNEGIHAARSKYVIFADATDIFVPETLAFLYDVAEKTQADVVHTSAHYVPQEPVNSLEEFSQPLSVQILAEEPVEAAGEDTILPDKDLPALLEDWLRNPAPPKIYNQLIRRDFLAQNGISLPSDTYMPEWIFGLQCICRAEKYVKIAQPLHIHIRDKATEADADIHKMISGIDALENFMGDTGFFVENAEARRAVLTTYMRHFIAANS